MRVANHAQANRCRAERALALALCRELGIAPGSLLFVLTVVGELQGARFMHRLNDPAVLDDRDHNPVLGPVADGHEPVRVRSCRSTQCCRDLRRLRLRHEDRERVAHRLCCQQ